MEGEQSEVSETVRGGIVHSLPLSIGGELPRPPVALGSGIQRLWSLVAFIHSSPLESSLSRAMTGNDTTFYLINHDNSSFTLTNNSPSLSHTHTLSLSLGHRPPSQQPPHHLPPTWGPLQKSQSTLPRPPLADLAR